MSVWVMVAGLASGAMIGFMGGVLGIGGGMIAIPALVLTLGMSQQMAQGTALIMVLPTIMMAVRKYHQQARIDLRVAAAGAAGAMFFTWVGARLALGIPSSTLRMSFAVFLFVIALHYIQQTLRRGKPAGESKPAAEVPATGATSAVSHAAQTVATPGVVTPGVATPGVAKPPAATPPAFTPRRACVLGMVCGTLGGFFGVGGAVLAVPILTSVFRLPQTTAQALALSMVIPGSTIALVTYTWAGEANWWVGLPLAIGSLFFVPVGVRLAYRLPERRLRIYFAAMLMATVALLVFEG
ncbi:sulfite exporter TauE/SafE family protein [Pseudomonadota bacterium AL_CKDN230030165-1A_HGKHYDSX7]